MTKINFVIGLLLLISTSAFAQEEIPSVIQSGFAAYQKDGAKAAVAAWLKGSPMESNNHASEILNSALGEIQDAYGKFTGYEVARFVKISPSCEMIYIVAKFEKGPFYCQFECYKPDNSEWIVPHLKYDAEISKVFTSAIIAGAP